MDAYEIWRDTKSLRASRPDDAEYLDSVLTALQPAALKGYLEAHAGLNGNEEPMTFDADEIAEFLAGLDELRALSEAELNDLKAQLMADALKALRTMRGLNWTGEHTYGEAIDDVEKVLDKVWRGEPFPKLERFRCPSLWQPDVRCQYQLPHGGNHKYDSGDGERHVVWTDEQSINPPKNYDEPIEICGAHPYDSTSKDPIGSAVCVLPAGHSERHNDGATWSLVHVAENGRTW